MKRYIVPTASILGFLSGIVFAIACTDGKAHGGVDSALAAESCSQ